MWNVFAVASLTCMRVCVFDSSSQQVMNGASCPGGGNSNHHHHFVYRESKVVTLAEGV